MTQTPSLAFDFEQAAHTALRDHPRIKETTLFISTAQPRRMVGSARAKKLLRAEGMDIALRCLVRITHDRNETSAVFGHPSIRSRAVILNPSRNGALEDHHQFAHELGHILSPVGIGYGALSESVADAYATQHLYRAAGQDADSFTARHIWLRCHDLVSHGADDIYAATPMTLLAAQERAHRTRQEVLSPEARVTLATNIAIAHTPYGDALSRVTRPFSALRQKEKLSLQCLASTCLKSADDLTFLIGAVVLNPFLDQAGTLLRKKTQTAFVERFNACAWRDQLVAQRKHVRVDWHRKTPAG